MNQILSLDLFEIVDELISKFGFWVDSIKKFIRIDSFANSCRNIFSYSCFQYALCLQFWKASTLLSCGSNKLWRNTLDKDRAKRGLARAPAWRLAFYPQAPHGERFALHVLASVRLRSQFQGLTPFASPVGGLWPVTTKTSQMAV